MTESTPADVSNVVETDYEIGQDNVEGQCWPVWL